METERTTDVRLVGSFGFERHEERPGTFPHTSDTFLVTDRSESERIECRVRERLVKMKQSRGKWNDAGSYRNRSATANNRTEANPGGASSAHRLDPRR